MDFERLYQELPKQPIKWTVSDVQIWLKFIGLSNLFPKFQQLSIDGSCFNSLTEEDLRQQLNIQSGIIIKKIMSWISRGLNQYTKIVDTKEAAGYSQIAEITQKPRLVNLSSLPPTNIEHKQSFKSQTNKIIPTMSLPLENPRQILKQEIEQQMIDQDQQQQNKKKQFQLIINQYDGPQTSFFSVKEQGAKIGRHSSNQMLILDQSISRYHAEIKFQNEGFFLRDVGSTTGTFIKIDNRKVIYNNMIIEMGSNQFYAKLSGSILNLQIIQGPSHGSFIQIPKQGKVNIGRKPSNLINFPDDQHLSNVHSMITYFDCKYYIEDMGTTNGTWERLSVEGENSELFQILDKSMFKIGSNQTYVCRIKTNYVSQKTHPNACVICCDQDKDCVYLPCKHNTACIKCSKNLKECPICRVKIQDFVRIYKS